MIETVSTSNAPAAIGPYSQAKKIGGFIFLSGQIPLIPETGELAENDIGIQTEQVIKNIFAILDEENLSAQDIIKTTCFLINMEDFEKFNNTYATFFTNKPARSCVAVKNLPKNSLVEIEVIAFCGEK